MGLFDALLGGARGLNQISHEYTAQLEKDKETARQNALTGMQYAYNLNDGASFDTNAAAAGITMPGAGHSLELKRQSSERKGALEELGLKTNIKAQEHGMTMADKTFAAGEAQRGIENQHWDMNWNQGLKSFAETVRQFNATRDDNNRHHADQVGLSRLGLMQGAQQHADSLRMQERGYSLEEQRMLRNAPETKAMYDASGVLMEHVWNPSLQRWVSTGNKAAEKGQMQGYGQLTDPSLGTVNPELAPSAAPAGMAPPASRPGAPAPRPTMDPVKAKAAADSLIGGMD